MRYIVALVYTTKEELTDGQGFFEVVMEEVTSKVVELPEGDELKVIAVAPIDE